MKNSLVLTEIGAVHGGEVLSVDGVEAGGGGLGQGDLEDVGHNTFGGKLGRLPVLLFHGKEVLPGI